MLPKGTLVGETGNVFVKEGYRIKIFNTINFQKSMKYNIKNISGHFFFEEFVKIHCPKGNTDDFNTLMILINKVEYSVIVNI